MNYFREDRDETVAKIRDTKPTDSQRKYKSENTQIRVCNCCGRKHVGDKSKCPAYGKTCSQCGRDNNFAANCREKPARKHVYAIHKDGHGDQEYVLKINYKSDYKSTTAYYPVPSG